MNSESQSKGALNNLSSNFTVTKICVKMPSSPCDEFIVSIRNKANEAVLKTYESSKETKSSSGSD